MKDRESIQRILKWLIKQGTREVYIEIITEEDKTVLGSGEFPDHYWNNQITEHFFGEMRERGLEPVSYRFLDEEEFIEKVEEKRR